MSPVSTSTKVSAGSVKLLEPYLDDTFLVRGRGPHDGYRVRYLTDPNVPRSDVSKQVEAGTYSLGPLWAGAAAYLRIHVKAPDASATLARFPVRFTSVGDGAKVDLIRVTAST